jgi:transposase
MQFRAMLRWRNAKRLIAWIDRAIASPFQFLAQFANTLRRDIAAVELALRLSPVCSTRMSISEILSS